MTSYDSGENRSADSESQEDLEREYTLSISDEDRQKSFEIEDRRWERSKIIQDWVVLGIAIVVWLAFQLSFYFLVPGIK